MKLYCTTNKQTYEVYIPINVKNYATKCPICHAERKKQNAKSFSFDSINGIGKCFHCDNNFVEFKQLEKFEPKEVVRPIFKKPKLSENLNVSIKMIEYFNSRKISKKTIDFLKITESFEFMPQISKEANCVCFNYFRENELVNIKYRDARKNFKLSSGAELIPYNIDNITENIIWCEGEFDACSWIEVGLTFAVSVPNGASRTKQNLVYIDNTIDLYDKVKWHYISTDNDEPGIKLKDELIRRFGAENCKIIDLLDCKDANEYLIKYGNDSLIQRFNEAKEIPIKGIYDLEADFDNVYDLWANGMKKGLTIEHEKLNESVSWTSSAVAVWTGIPSQGKSEFVDEVCVQLNIYHDWRVAYFSPENFPVKFHISKLASRLSARKFSKEHLSESNMIDTVTYIRDNFFWINPEDEDVSVDSILNHAKILVKTKGIKVLVIDPWNKLDHRYDKGDNETSYISKALDKFDTFAKKYDILIHLVAHPTKIRKNESKLFEVPEMYDIAGSAHFYNKAFYGFTVYRTQDFTELYIRKVKFKHLGNTAGGKVQFHYNINNGRYCEVSEILTEPNWNNKSFLKYNDEIIQNIEQPSNYNNPISDVPF